MKVAVIGAGIFGTTIAIKLADRGFDVDIFEKENDILQAASGINQYRLHRGYHYPRSKETSLSSKTASPIFASEYKEAIIEDNKHYYCIPKSGSKISGSDFLKFCMECELEHERTTLEHLKEEEFDLVIRGQESLINPIVLREIILKKIKERRINLMLGRAATAKDFDGYDKVVNCTYANLNYILEECPEARREYQFELCEKPVLKLPDAFKGVSAVVMDGPFFCFDPYADTGLHVMGNVVHAIHVTNVGLFPRIPEEFYPLLNKGVVKSPKISNIEKFIESASHFVPELAKAEHIGSMYTVRTVLPNVDHTDERPTLVKKVNDKIVNVFSGKIGNCVQAAREVVEMLQEKN